MLARIRAVVDIADAQPCQPWHASARAFASCSSTQRFRLSDRLSAAAAAAEEASTDSIAEDRTDEAYGKVCSYLM